MNLISKTSNRRRALWGIALLAMGSLLAAQPVAAQSGSWPTHPVRIIVPFAPGGTTDILARAMAPELSKAFGQQFIIDNKPTRAS